MQFNLSTDLPQEHKHLGQRLEEFRSAQRPGRLSLALRLGSDPLLLEYDGPGTLRKVDDTQSSLALAGCFAKPLTASLLADAVNTGHVDWSTPVNEVLGTRGVMADRLAGIAFAHLLNHTHGLDASAITVEMVQRNQRGFIDEVALCECLPVRRLNTPGELYSYSNAGAWLAGAALERLTDTPYTQLLSASPYTVSSEVLPTHSPGPWCPSSGGLLALTTAQWLSFAELHADSALRHSDSPPSGTLASLRTSRVALPGWSPAEQAACLGWKYYGEGWFGHTANTTGSISFLRFNPDSRVAIVMSGTSDIALFAFSCLFRDYFPELKGLKFPRRLKPAEQASLQIDSYVGLYTQSKTQIEITKTDDGRLSFAIHSDDSGLRVPRQLLDAAENGIFFPNGKRTPELPFIQLLRAPGCDFFSHLWNGKHLWRRN